ncbi:MAG: TonB-dependent receptor [Ferruginibacter sp.]|nr:TonB-dependent receptor [Ferruginibacter sp.]
MVNKFLFGMMMWLMGFNVSGQVSISGKVTDQQSKPLVNAAVHLLNTQQNAFTDAAGFFSMHGVAKGKYTIEISATNHATILSTIDVDGNNASFNFQLHNSLVQLEAVTVTAEKKEESLQNIPTAITALSSGRVEQLRLWNIKDITAIVPNVYSGNSGDERNVTSIRGITTTSYDPAVATYVDGVNQFSLDTYIPQLSDIERIEILRGPQGTLYGRNAMGGVINIITKQPANHTSGFVELNFGDYNMQRYSAGIRTPLVNDKLFFGASMVYNKRNGYYNNQFNNRSFDRQSALTGNYYLKWLAAAKWAITANLKHQNDNNNGAFPMVNGVDDALKDPFQVNQNAVAKMIDNSLNASLSVHHTGAYFDFSSQLAWQNNHRYYDAPLDGDFSPVDAVTIINDYGKQWNNVKVLTHELKFNSAASKSSRLSWAAGTYFFHQYNPVKQATHFGKDAGLLGVPATDFSTINITKGNNTGIAVYGQINYELLKKLGLIAGMRYDYENKELEVTGEYQPDGQGAMVTTPDTAAAAHFQAVSPKLGLQYQLNDHHNVYASYSRGFRTGGLTQLSSDPSQPPLYPYQPEYSNNVEVGFKNNLFADRFHLNVSGFYTIVNNAQLPTLVLPEAITVTRNTGELTSKGAELEVLVKPVKGFQAEYSLGYTDAQYKSLKVSQNGQSVNLDGKRQIFTPEVTSMLGLQYSWLLSTRHSLQLIARGEWYYLGTQYFDLANTIRQSPFHLLNARVGLSSSHFEVFCWARNLTNTKHIEYAYDFGAVHLGNPRTIGVTLKALF